MKIVLATSNEHKVKEINAIVSTLLSNSNNSIEFVLTPPGFDPDETGLTFEENSYIKAYEAWKLSHTWTLADDSGLCIKSLGGKPGIHSARYAETPQKRIDRVLVEMQNSQDRTAEFVCAMTLINPDGNIEFKCKGICPGSIVLNQRGTHGFGYDPIFLLQNSYKTMAELSDEEKNIVSHRGKALRMVVEYINQNLA